MFISCNDYLRATHMRLALSWARRTGSSPTHRINRVKFKAHLGHISNPGVDEGPASINWKHPQTSGQHFIHVKKKNLVNGYSEPHIGRHL